MKTKPTGDRFHGPHTVPASPLQHPFRSSGGPGLWGIRLLLLLLCLAGPGGVRAQRWAWMGAVMTYPADGPAPRWYEEPTASDWVSFSGGNALSVALKADGTVGSWGLEFDELKVPVGLSGVVAVAAGADHALTLKSDTTVVAWGWNSYGQTTVPAGLSGVVALAAGYGFSLALKSDGTVTAWGKNGYGQCDVPADLSDVVAIAAGDKTSMALKSDGTVRTWGSEEGRIGPVPDGLSGVVAISLRYQTFLALKRDGTVVAWGSNQFGQTNLPAGLSGVVSVSARELRCMALKGDGTAVMWGHELPAQGTVVTGPSGLVAVSDFVALRGIPDQAPTIFSPHAAVATMDSGTFYYRIVTSNPATAFAAQGLPEGLTLDPVTGIITGTPAVAGSFTISLSATNPFGSVERKMILTVTGTPLYTGTTLQRNWIMGLPVPGRLFATGQPRYSADGLPPGTWMDPDSGTISGTPGQFGQYHVRFTFTKPGATAVHEMDIGVTNVVAWGDNEYGQSTVPYGLGGIKAIAAGRGQSMALKADGTVVTWGDNYGGRITVPAGLSDVVAIAAGDYHSLALKRNGTVVAWGENHDLAATVPTGLSGVVAIASGARHSLALKGNGSVVGWGYSTAPFGVSGVVAIAAGGNNSLALKGDGTVVGWSIYGELVGSDAVPAGLSGVVAIAAGFHHFLALKADGTVVAWGSSDRSDYNVRFPVPVGLSDVVAIAAGDENSLALKRDGTPVGWGLQNGSYGALSPYTVPSGLSAVAAAASARNHSMVLTGPALTSPSTASVRVSQPFSHAMTSWADTVFSASPLPDGLILNPATGVISGSVATAGRSDMLIKASHPATGLSLSSVFRLHVLDSDFAAWRTRYFGALVLPDARPEADPDGDGMANLFEYARGTNPHLQDPESVTTPVRGSAGSRDLYLEVLAPTAAELAGRAQFADTPLFVSPAEVSTPTASEALPSGYQRLTFTDPAAGPLARRFGRVLVSLRP